jgi:hypothetical protein
MYSSDITKNPVIIQFPALIKASTEGERRLVKVEASSEAVDAEGDVILQKALMDSAPDFIKNGHLDLEHFSEIGARIGIVNPSSYIVGRPTEVVDLGNGRTGVTGEIMRSQDGSFSPDRYKYDEFWQSMQSEPPVKWRASIYGFPKAGMTVDCSQESCGGGATRYLVKGIDWRSLAFTRNPVNTDLKGYAKIVTAKAFIEFLKGASPLMPGTLGLNEGMAGMAPAMSLAMPFNLDGAVGQYHRHMKGDCPFTKGVNSVKGFHDHFSLCCGAPADQAALFAHALMYHLLLEKKRAMEA